MTPVLRRIPCVPPHELKVELETRFTDGVHGLTRDILRDFNVQLEHANKMFRELYKFACVAKYAIQQVAYQFFQIEAGDLGSSDDPDGNPVVRSVLNTASQSDFEFNWMQSGGTRTYKVVTGPGDGVPTHHVIIDRDNANIHIQKWEAVGADIEQGRENVCRPYGMTGLQLQFGYWVANAGVLEFWPTSIAVGTWVYLEQELPYVEIP